MIPQRVPRHDVTDLALRTISTEIHGENLKEGSIPICWMVLMLHLKFQGQNFLKEGRM